MPTGPIAGVPAHTGLPASGEQPYIAVPGGGTIYLPAGAQLPGTSMFDPDDLDRPVTPDQPSTRLLRPPRWAQWQVNGATGGATTYSFAIVATSGVNDSQPTALLVATGAQAALSSSNNIQLNWGFVPGVTGWKVLYWTGSVYQLVATLPPGQLTYQVTTVAALPGYTASTYNPLAPLQTLVGGMPKGNKTTTTPSIATTASLALAANPARILASLVNSAAAGGALLAIGTASLTSSVYMAILSPGGGAWLDGDSKDAWYAMWLSGSTANMSVTEIA